MLRAGRELGLLDYRSVSHEASPVDEPTDLCSPLGEDTDLRPSQRLPPPSWSVASSIVKVVTLHFLKLLPEQLGRPYPVARIGYIPSTTVMLYAPRDLDELEVVYRLVLASYHFAGGHSDRES